MFKIVGRREEYLFKELKYSDNNKLNTYYNV
jgi:hypothetical protein